MALEACEILMNATQVSQEGPQEVYEFVLDGHLVIRECVHISSLSRGVVMPIDNFATQLHTTLFELNHVRVNPRIDNRSILKKIQMALESIGIEIAHPPHEDSMAMCFRPLGELKQVVRFHFNPLAQVTFLAPRPQLKVLKTAACSHTTSMLTRPF